jgi:hypothetical protein
MTSNSGFPRNRVGQTFGLRRLLLLVYEVHGLDFGYGYGQAQKRVSYGFSP